MLTHIGADHIKAAMNLNDIDLLNPHLIKVSVSTSDKNHLGVSLAHGEKGEVQLNTHSRAIVVDHERQVAEGYHTVSTGAGFNDGHELILEPLADLDGKLVIKRTGQLWKDMKPENVDAGVYKSQLGNQTKYLIGSQSADGKPSAIHRFLRHNSTNAKLFGGAYMEGKVKFTTLPSGEPAIPMEPEHFKEVRDSLHKSLTTKSPFQHGLAAVVTNIGNAPVASKTPTFVNVQIQRTPVTQEGLAVHSGSKVVSAFDVAAMGGKNKPAGAASRLGFEGSKIAGEPTISEFKPTDSIATANEIVENNDVAEPIE